MSALDVSFRSTRLARFLHSCHPLPPGQRFTPPIPPFDRVRTWRRRTASRFTHSRSPEIYQSQLGLCFGPRDGRRWADLRLGIGHPDL